MENRDANQMMLNLKKLYDEYAARDARIKEEFEEAKNKLDALVEEARELQHGYYTMSDEVGDELGWETYFEERNKIGIENDLGYWLPSEYSCQ